MYCLVVKNGQQSARDRLIDLCVLWNFIFLRCLKFHRQDRRHADSIMGVNYDIPACCALHANKHRKGRRNKVDQNLQQCK